MKRFFLILVVMISILINGAMSNEIKKYVVAGKFIEKNDAYIFKIEESWFSISSLKTIEYKGYDACIKIHISEEVFDSSLKFDEKMSITVTDKDLDGIYEIDNGGMCYDYILWDKIHNMPEDYIKGYFVNECGEISFHDEYFGTSNVYKFNIVDTESEYPKYSDYVYIVYEKDYFDNKISYDKGYSFYIFDTGEVYQDRNLYIMYNVVNLSYFDTFKFYEYDKDEMVEQNKEEKRKNIKMTLIPMAITVGVMMIGGILSMVKLKKKL